MVYDQKACVVASLSRYIDYCPGFRSQRLVFLVEIMEQVRINSSGFQALYFNTLHLFVRLHSHCIGNHPGIGRIFVTQLSAGMSALLYIVFPSSSEMFLSNLTLVIFFCLVYSGQSLE